MRKLFFSVLLFCSSLAIAQTTTVTATIIDSDSVAWSNAIWTATFVPNPNFPNLDQYTINGTPITSSTYNSYINVSGTTNSSGVLSTTLLDNNIVLPGGSTYKFVVQSNSSAPASSYPNEIITGTSQSLTTFLSINSVAPRFPAVGNAFGYADGEISIIPQPGGSYFNVINSVIRIWTGSSWINGNGSNAKVSNGISYSAAYTQTDIGARINACIVDAETLANGNTTGICSAEGELSLGAGVTTHTPIILGDVNGDTVTLRLPAACKFNFFGGNFTGSVASTGVTQYSNTRLQAQAGVGTCKFVNNTGISGNMYALWLGQSSTSNSAGTYAKIDGGILFQNGSFATPVTTASGHDVIIQYITDNSQFKDINIVDYESGQIPLQIGGNAGSSSSIGNICCASTIENLNINGEYATSTLLQITGNSTNGSTNLVSIINASLDHPVPGGAVISCTDTQHQVHVSFNHLYSEIEWNNSGQVAPIYIDGTTSTSNACANINITDEEVKNEGSYQAPVDNPIWQLNGTYAGGLQIIAHTDPFNFTQPTTVIQNNITTYCASTPCNIVTDNNGYLPGYHTGITNFDQINMLQVPQLLGTQWIGSNTNIGPVSCDGVTITCTNGQISTSGGIIVTSTPPWAQFLGTGTDGSNTNASGSLSGSFYYTNFTVPFGNTVNVNSNIGLTIHATGTCTIAGTINAKGNISDSVTSVGGGSGGGSGGGTLAGIAGINTYLTNALTGSIASSGGTAGTSTGGNGNNGATPVTGIIRVLTSNGGGADGAYLGGSEGSTGGSTGGAGGRGASAVLLICHQITGTDGTHTGVIDVSGNVGSPPSANLTGAGSGGGGGIVLLSSQLTIPTLPTIYTAPGSGSLNSVPEALGISGSCTTEPQLTLGVSGGALSGTCTIVTAGAGCGTGTGVTFSVLGGGGTLGTGTINPTWSGGTVASCTTTAGTSSGYTASTFTTSGIGGNGGNGWTAVFQTW